MAEDRARVAEIIGLPAPTIVHTTGLTWGLVGPDVRVVWNSAIPYSLNDGPLWAGRGANASLTAGVAVDYERGSTGLYVVVAPTILYSENLPFDILPGRAPGRSLYSSPWHLTAAEGSADLPLRFGDRAIEGIDPGETSVTMRVKNAAFGFSNASEWWGPGIRNALVMSNNAPGIPRAFVRNAAPVRTPVGQFNGELVIGTLTKSLYFDTLASSDYRSFSGLVLSYRPQIDSNLTLGVARGVYAPATGAFPNAGAWLNALRWRPSAGNGSPYPADQIASLFWRWVFPASGLEAYGEWARQVLPSSLAEIIQTPYNTEGYTLGFQWAIRRARPDHVLRLQSELTYLDQNVVYSNQPPADFYTGRAALQGYTQRGQIIGAAIGPGGSSQWIALDQILPRYQLGLFVGRIRWEDNAMYRQPFVTFFSHDVSVLGGVRGAYRLPLVDVSAELTAAYRQNYLFQNGFGSPNNQGTVNVRNITLATRVTPR